jgi:stress response protein SCP2/predicted type IV restriction endonuclease
MSIKLERGSNISLTNLSPKANTLYIGLGWSSSFKSSEDTEVDASCFMLNDQRHVRNNNDFIFYNQQQDLDKAVYLIDDLEEDYQGTDKTGFVIDLKKLSSEICRVVFCLTIHNIEKNKHYFSMFDFVQARIVDQDSFEEIAYFRCEQDLEKETAILVGEIYRYNNEWKFKAIAQGYNNGLGDLAQSFGVLLDEVNTSTTEIIQNNNELVLTKKKRKSSKEVIDEQIESIRYKINLLLPQIRTSINSNVNESSTRIVLDRIFQDVLGYTIDEIKTEQKIQGRVADYILAPDGVDTIVIEAKRAGTPLRQKQIFQATSYAAYSGINWAILTNLLEWQFYKVSTIDKVDPHLVFTIDLQRGLDEENLYNLMLISKFGVLRKNLIDKVWLKKVCLKLETLIGAILNEEVINKIRTIITKETGGQITNEEIKKAIETDILKV